MWGKRITSMLLMSLIIIGIISIPVSAAEVDNSSQASGQMNLANARATGVLNFTLSANTSKVAGQKFQMDAGETVRINASYTPFAADVDFGLVDSDGVFHYINVTDGNIDETILIEEKGYYTLRIRNNSNVEVQVSGFVNY